VALLFPAQWLMDWKRVQVVAGELIRLAAESRDIHFVGARYVPPSVKPPEHAIGTPLTEVLKKPGTAAPRSEGGLSRFLCHVSSKIVWDEFVRASVWHWLPATKVFDVVSPASKTSPMSQDPGVLSPGVYRKRVVRFSCISWWHCSRHSHVLFTLALFILCLQTYLRLCREHTPVNFTNELWGALRGSLTELADWIADQNRLGGSASKAGLKRKVNRNGNIVGAYFVVADLEQELKAEKEAKLVATLKRNESIEAAHEKDRADMYGVRGSPPESRTSPNHMEEKLIAVSVSNKVLAKTTVGMNKNRFYDGEERVVAQVLKLYSSLPSCHPWGFFMML
jgi:hypothetical protein